jgi:uncharacterized small protein (DUF1192 family)
MSPPEDLDRLSHAELYNLVVKQCEQLAEVQRMVAALRDEIARLRAGRSVGPSRSRREAPPSANAQEAACARSSRSTRSGRSKWRRRHWLGAALGRQAAFLFALLWIGARSSLQEAGQGGFP